MIDVYAKIFTAGRVREKKITFPHQKFIKIQGIVHAFDGKKGVLAKLHFYFHLSRDVSMPFRAVCNNRETECEKRI